MSNRARSLFLAAAFFAGSLVGLTAAAVSAVQHLDPYYDCTIQSPCGNATQACLIRWGRCETGGIDGVDGFHDPNNDGCGCDLGP